MTQFYARTARMLMDEQPDFLPPGKMRAFPRPEPDETFSSWFVRVAWTNGLGIAGFVGALKWTYRQAAKSLSGKHGLKNREPDRLESEPIPEIMAQATGLPGEELRSLRIWTPKTHSNHFIRIGLMDRIRGGTAPALRHKQSAGSFCPECLAESYYLRRSWRLALSPCCHIHQRVLLDGCPRCHQSLEFYWHDPSEQHERNRPNLHCRRCRFDLVMSATHPPDLPIRPESLALQSYFLERFGWAQPGYYYGVRSEYDMILRFLALIAKHAYSGDQGVWLVPRSHRGGEKRFYLNRQSCEIRYALLATASQLMCGVPEKKPAIRLGLQFYKDGLQPTAAAVLEEFMEKTFPAFLGERRK